MCRALPLAVCVAIAPPADAQELDRAKKVLVLNTAKQDERFSQTAEREIPKQLTEDLGERIDYYTEYFDANRFPHPQYEAVYVDFLRRKYAGKRIDLLLLMGEVAVDFVARHRDELFPGTPAVFYALVPPRSRLPNSTGLLNRLQFGPSLDLALALQPDLTHVYVVIGATPGDSGFADQARQEFRRFEQRLQFTYLSDLKTSDLDTRLGALPPRSAVYYVVVSTDAAGQAVQQMAYLSRIAAAANAPTYSWADIASETGILGGRRRDQVAQVKALATLGLRVLRGERADDIPVSSPNTDVDTVDWRQLRRWGIAESRVPRDTRVLFRPPGIWSLYKRYIIGAIVLFLTQTALIAGLLLQRTRRQRVEDELRGSQARLHVSYDRIRHLTRRLLGEQDAERARIARELHDDISQQLVLLAVELDRLRSGHLPAHGARQVSRALETTHSISTSVRELSHRLHPSKLQLIGLVNGLESLRRDFSQHFSTTFCHRHVPAEIDLHITLCLFRVAQEALANAVKHSHARQVNIDLTGAASAVALTIFDDGKGFDVDGMTSMGLGLISMRERVEAVGGVLEIRSATGSGTRLKVTIPTQATGSVQGRRASG